MPIHPVWPSSVVEPLHGGPDHEYWLLEMRHCHGKTRCLPIGDGGVPYWVKNAVLQSCLLCCSKENGLAAYPGVSLSVLCKCRHSIS